MFNFLIVSSDHKIIPIAKKLNARKSMSFNAFNLSAANIVNVKEYKNPKIRNSIESLICNDFLFIIPRFNIKISTKINDIDIKIDIL